MRIRSNYFTLKPAIVALALTLFGCNDGYVGICAKAIEEQRTRFKAICESRSDRDLQDGSLESVVKRRNELLYYNGCQLKCESWKCGRKEYEDYEMEVKNLSTCGRRE